VIRSADLRLHGTGTVTVTDAVPRSGELAAFCRPVVTAPVLVKRDGTVLADGWLPDFVRLGELEPHLGDGVIEAVVDAALQAGRLKRRQRRRIMSYPLVIRLMIAMTLMPDASYGESLARLTGLLADIPSALEWHVPGGEVITGWRLLVPADVMESLFWQAAGPLTGDGEPSAVMLAGMPVGAADGHPGQPGRHAGEPGVLRLDRDRGRLIAVPAAQDHRRHRPRRACHAGRGPRAGGHRGADPAEEARAAAAGAVPRPGRLLRQELSRP
jgi:hypothetical protein